MDCNIWLQFKKKGSDTGPKHVLQIAHLFSCFIRRIAFSSNFVNKMCSYIFICRLRQHKSLFLCTESQESWRRDSMDDKGLYQRCVTFLLIRAKPSCVLMKLFSPCLFYTTTPIVFLHKAKQLLLLNADFYIANTQIKSQRT